MRTAKQIQEKLQVLKLQLRDVRDDIKDIQTERQIERVLLTAARHGVEASEAELNSAIVALEHLTSEK